MSSQNNQQGFSLIECVVAIALLATLVGSMISLESSVLRILQFSTNKAKATIVLNSTIAQFEYLSNVKEKIGLPTTDTPLIWESKLNPEFTNTLRITNPDIKLSQFILSALNIYYMDTKDMNPDTIKLKFGPIADSLDIKMSLMPASAFVDNEFAVEWAIGKETKKLSEKILLMNNDAIDTLKIP